MKKRAISFVVAVLVLISCFPQFAFAADATTLQKGDGWGNWSEFVVESSVVIYPVEGGNIYFGQELYDGGDGSFYEGDAEKNQIRLLAADSGVTKVQIPSTVNGLTVTTISEWAFGNCTQLSYVEIPQTVEAVYGVSFWGCLGLEEIRVADGNTNCYSADGVLYTKSYHQQTNTEIITLELYPSAKPNREFAVPTGVTNIAQHAFSYAVSLKKISIPASVISIQAGSFIGEHADTHVKDVYYAGTEQQWNEIKAGGVEDLSYGASIHYNQYESFGGAVGGTAYTVADIEQMVEAYYNEHLANESYPGTYVVFSSETIVDGTNCCVVVRFQGDNATVTNVFVADAIVDMDTGEMFVDGALLGHLWPNSGSSGNGEPVVEDVAELKIYTTYPSTSIGVEQVAGVLLKLLVNGEQVPIQGYVMNYSNPDVVKLVDTEDLDGERLLTFEGLSPGSSTIHFTENSTGASASITIYVEESVSYYRCEQVTDPAVFCYPIYVANFTCKINENGNHDICFDAYNCSYAYGVVIVYSADGTFLKCLAINPIDDGVLLEHAFNCCWYIWDNLRNAADNVFGDDSMQWYEESGNAQLTKIRLTNVPPNARIVVTADEKESVFPTLYTGLDIFVQLSFAAASISASNNAQREVVSKLTETLIDELQMEMIEASTARMSEAMLNSAINEAAYDTYDIVFNVLNSVSENANEILEEALDGLYISAANTIFKLAIPIMQVEELIEKEIAVLNSIWDYSENSGKGKLEIHCIKHGHYNQLQNNAVTATCQNGFNGNTILDAYPVPEDRELADIPQSMVEGLNNYQIYNITLRQDGVEIQPEEEIEIRLPIPKGADGTKCVVYRAEENGERTRMDTTLKAEELVFRTSHLSVYVIGEDINYHEPNSIPVIPVIIGILSVLLVVLILGKCNKRNR